MINDEEMEILVGKDFGEFYGFKTPYEDEN